jgi:hypothetical protein
MNFGRAVLFRVLNVNGSGKSSNSRRANFEIMRRTNCTLNDCEMQRNAEVGLFTEPFLLEVSQQGVQIGQRVRRTAGDIQIHRQQAIQAFSDLGAATERAAG